MSNEVVFLYVTTPDEACANRIALRLVDDGNAACVNVLRGMTSFYRWQGAVEHSEECVLIVKCARAAAARARQTILEMHPHEIPAIAGLPVDPSSSSPAFLAWVQENSGD
jgi:periplasmic divalent cation tolerance protein